MRFTTHYGSPLGGITLASDGKGLTGLWFEEGQKHFTDTHGANFEEHADLPIFNDTRRWLDVYFSGGIPQFSPTLHLSGTPFRLCVWEILRTIPYGHTLTYGHIARRIARERGLHTMSAQAVGGAVGHNPIALIIPCHRVIGSGGTLTGYAAGLDRKRHLLRMEGALA